MRFSEQEIALIFRIIGLLFIPGLGYLVFRHWFDHLRGYRSRPASFDPAETMAELIRLAPDEAEIIPLQDAVEADGILCGSMAGSGPCSSGCWTRRWSLGFERS